MQLRRRPPPPPPLVGDHAHKLSQVRGIKADPEERQSHDDFRLPPVLIRFAFPVELPRALRPRRRRPRRRRRSVRHPN